MQKQIFLGTQSSGGAYGNSGWNCPRIPPCGSGSKRNHIIYAIFIL